MEFTIATWNIAGGRPIRTDGLFDYADEDINYFADELRKINPDVICLQETHMNDERSVAGGCVQCSADTKYRRCG